MNSLNQPFESVFARIHDVVVVGSGYAAFAAAMSLHRQGRKVLLVDRSPAILQESAWGMFPEVGPDAGTDAGAAGRPEWQALLAKLTACGAADNGRIDGALAEVVATRLLIQSGLPVLYYAIPLAAERSDGGLLESVLVGTKAGVQRLAGRQWIDATETGELAAVLDSAWKPGAPSCRIINLFFRAAIWPSQSETQISCADLSGAKLTWRTSLWPDERRLEVELPGTEALPRLAWPAAMRAAREQLPQEMAGAILTHGSVIPLDVYDRAAGPAKLPANVLPAIAAAAGAPSGSLAGRFGMGLDAASATAAAPSASPAQSLLERPIEPPAVPIAPACDVAVAGVGTGGVMAAVAAAREGAKVTAFDLLPFAGGIGAGGGIHWYYYGVRGGLQDELDERTRNLMPLFGPTPQLRGFHPDAKKIACEQMLVEAGVTNLFGAMLIDVQRQGHRVTSALVGTAEGGRSLSAPVWIDATGDGDVAARAGAEFRMGRTHDGGFHAYSQSSGRVVIDDGKPAMRLVNYDAGWVDPTDSQDLTRARLIGVDQYHPNERFDPVARPTYIAPAIGLRQARMIQTDYVLSLADLVESRTFADVVGLTGCHYDNHATDYEFESDESVFYVWVCRMWRTRTACQFPYRILLPRGVQNVLLACRALGVSDDAHHSFRMQRDFQRVGEVAGLAAALSLPAGDVRRIAMPKLQEQLKATGAIETVPHGDDGFGPELAAEAQKPLPLPPATAEQLASWLSDLQTAQPGVFLWHLYRHAEQAKTEVMRLLKQGSKTASWRCAAIAAMWPDPAAEPRLCQAIASREYGFDDAPEKDRPEKNSRLAPNWFVAISLLRRCGTPACLTALYELSADATLVHNARTAAAITIATISGRCKLTAEQKNLADQALKRLLATPAPNATGNPQKNVSVAGGQRSAEATPGMSAVAVEDFTWQLHLAIAKAEHALGQPIHKEALVYLRDPRATVRRAFSSVTQRY